MTRKQLAIVIFVVGLISAIVAAGWGLLRSELAPVGVGVEAPDFTVNTIDSIPQKRSLDDYRGNVIMINIWATWCVPCRVEMPSIEQLHRTYQGKGLRILAVSVDEPGAEQEIRNYVRQYGLTFDVLHDPGGQEGRVPRAYQTNGYPETVIIGRDGIIRKKLLGAHNWNSAENRALIDRLLAERAE